MLTADSKLDPEWLLDDTNISSLRRRKVLTNRCVTSHSSDSSINISTNISSTSNPFRSINFDENFMKSRKIITYPKVTTTYPKILSNSTIYLKDINKKKKLDYRYVKPPSSQPPIFLKCKVKKKMKNNENKNSDNVDENSLTLSATTDLDIQFSKVNFESFSRFDLNLGSKTSIVSENMSQSLTQYCNFEDKKVMRIAPHIRRKDVICDTVDAWSYSNFSQNSTELYRYKPLIFGGTYPIDLPVKLTNDLCLMELKNVPMEKSITKTYDIDVPTNCE